MTNCHVRLAAAWINGGKVGAGDLPIEHRLLMSFVPGVEQSLRLVFAARAKAHLLTGELVLCVINAPRAFQESVSCFMSDFIRL